jgi:hypothetical protein
MSSECVVKRKYSNLIQVKHPYGIGTGRQYQETFPEPGHEE